MGDRYKHIDDDEIKCVERECTTSDEANREVGLMLVNELRELNYQLYQVQKAIRG